MQMFLIPKEKIQILKQVFRYFQVQMDCLHIIFNCFFLIMFAS